MTAKALPEGCQTLNRTPKIHRPTGKADRVDCAGRGADDHRKRIARTDRQQLGNRRQHTHLMGHRPSPAAGKNQHL